ncbi:hypothetical protein [Labrenzia sp. OB1]|uniref:hypothetical protein n=1 Tax=Labrenzia sp. OB1 TaxID=1561204 RepID=UPI0007B2E543|nr:hypothetical protein [Labrenzia sp. OB1]KZM48257.1 hypothetical protein OA90_21095 [Labrenzia sp. OB1]
MLKMRTEGYCDTQDFWNAGFLRPVLEALCKRPAAMAREGFADKFSEMDLWAFEAEVAAANRDRQREGLGSLPVFEQLYVRVLEWIDMEFAERPALPKPGRAA